MIKEESTLTQKEEIKDPSILENEEITLTQKEETSEDDIENLPLSDIKDAQGDSLDSLAIADEDTTIDEPPSDKLPDMQYTPPPIDSLTDEQKENLSVYDWNNLISRSDNKRYRSIPEDDTTLVESAAGIVKGTPEALLTGITELIGAFFGTVAAGELTVINALDPDTDVDVNHAIGLVNFVRDIVRYNPRTKEGQAILHMLGTFAHGMLTEPGEKAGDYVFDLTNNAGLATAFSIAPDAFAMLLPLSAAGKLETKQIQEIVASLKEHAENKNARVFDDVAPEPVATIKEQYPDKVKIKNAASVANKKQLETANTRLKELENKPASDLTATEKGEYKQLLEETTELNKKWAKEEGLSPYVVMKSPKEIYKKIPDTYKATYV